MINKTDHMTSHPFFEGPKNALKGIQPSIAFDGYISIPSKQVICKSNVFEPSTMPLHWKHIKTKDTFNKSMIYF